MSSDRPKVLHEVGGRPMVSHVIDAVRPVCTDGVVVVVGYGAEQVVGACGEDGVRFVRQDEQLGTGHAVAQCERELSGFSGTVIVLNGDVPCLTTQTIRRFAAYHDRQGAAATVLTAVFNEPTGYGRIVRGEAGELVEIVEEKDADDATRRIHEVNSGLFCFDKAKLFGALARIGRRNVQKEYYLTDVISVLRADLETVRAHRAEDPNEVAGVNTDEELSAIQRRFDSGDRLL